MTTIQQRYEEAKTAYANYRDWETDRKSVV